MADNIAPTDLFETYKVRDNFRSPIKLADRPVSYDLNRKIADPFARKIDPFEEQRGKEYKVFKDPPREKPRPKSPKQSPKPTKKENNSKSKTKVNDNTYDPLNSKNIRQYKSDVYDPFSDDARKNDFRAFDDPEDVPVVSQTETGKNRMNLTTPEEQELKPQPKDFRLPDDRYGIHLPPVVAPYGGEDRKRTPPQTKPMNYNRSGVNSRDSTHWRINKPLILPVVKNDIDYRPKPYIYDRNVNSKYGDFNFNFYMFYL